MEFLVVITLIPIIFRIFEPHFNLGLSFLFNSSKFLKIDVPLALAAIKKIIKNSSMASLLNLVGQLIDLRDEGLFTKMSGGEKQRVQLARVMAQIWEPTSTGAQFLVLDEPTAALDLSHQVLMMELVSDFAQRGIGVIIVSHDLNLATRFADHVIVFDKGSVVAAGAPDKILSETLISDVFGIDPYVIKHPETGKNIVVNW